MITTFYPPYSFGGDGIFVHRLSNELARRGHEVEVIHCRDSYRALAHTEPPRGYDDHPNVTVHGLESRFGLLSPLVTQQIGVPLFKSARIRRILARGFDVIHYHNISLVGGPRILRFGRGIKLYTMHEYWLVCPTHALFRFNRAACRRRYCLACTLTYRRPPQWWRYVGLLRASVKHVDAFIAPSQFTRDIHRRLGLNRPIMHIPLFVAPAGAPSAPTAPAVAPEPAPPYFLFAGRLERLKGLDTLIPLFRHYQKAQLWIAGTGSDDARLRRLAEGIGNVRFLGFLDSARLEPLYRDAVALIVPSICYESFVLVIIEAFRQQTPVIVRNLGAIPELVAESGGGLVYSSDAELVAAMDQLLADRPTRRELGVRGYQAYQQKWTPEAHLDRYLALIRQLAAARTAAAVVEVTERR
jgi:glycosyltransferase involved in cell wall biosynthesis